MFRSIKKGWKRAAQFVTETTGKVVQYVGDKLVAIVAELR